MKKIFCSVLALLVAVTGISLLAGCSKKEVPPSFVNEQARQALREGVVFLKQGDPLNAAKNFAAAIKVSPDYFEAYYMLAQTFINLKQYDQALAVLSMTVRRFPENPVAYYLQAVANQGAGNLMPAIVAARKSLDFFQAKKDAQGEQRAKVFLAALVQLAKKSSEAKMIADVAENAPKVMQPQTP